MCFLNTMQFVQGMEGEPLPSYKEVFSVSMLFTLTADFQLHWSYSKCSRTRSDVWLLCLAGSLQATEDSILEN